MKSCVCKIRAIYIILLKKRVNAPFFRFHPVPLLEGFFDEKNLNGNKFMRKEGSGTSLLGLFFSLREVVMVGSFSACSCCCSKARKRAFNSSSVVANS